jgi:hypothetical protein
MKYAGNFRYYKTRNVVEILFFCVVTPYRLTGCHNPEHHHCVTTHKNNIFIFIAARTKNLTRKVAVYPFNQVTLCCDTKIVETVGW